MSDLNLTPAAAAIVKKDVAAFKADGKRYAQYIVEMGVTVDDVADHVAAFRDAYKAATPKATGDMVKAYATKVRNGLNYNLGKKAEKNPTVALITALGAKAELDDVIAAWHAAQD